MAAASVKHSYRFNALILMSSAIKKGSFQKTLPKLDEVENIKPCAKFNRTVVVICLRSGSAVCSVLITLFQHLIRNELKCVNIN
jgi:hypothetical protein